MSTQRLVLNTRFSGERGFQAETPSGTSANSLDIWFLSLDQDQATVERARTFLDRRELARVERFVHERDAKRNILAHGLMRHLLAEATGQHPEQVRFTFGKFKKPFLAGDYSVQFNLSDTKDALIIAMNKGGEIGADIETMDRRVDHLAVADHYFTEREKEIIFNDEKEGKRRFLELWTKKEALLKATGVGIMDDLKLLDVSQERTELEIQHSEFKQMAAPEYHIDCFAHGEKHLISVASSSPISEVQLHDAQGLL